MRSFLLPSLLGILAACHATIEPLKGSCNADSTSDTPTVTAAIGVPAVGGASPTVEADPSVATNDTTYLVAWTDTLQTPDGKPHGRVSAALVDAKTGGVVSDVSIALRPGTDTAPSDVGGDDSMPVVSSNGDIFLVTWMHFDLTMPPATTLQGMRVDKSGALLDKAPFTIGELAPARLVSGAATAWTGTQWLVTWSRDSDDHGSIDLDGMFIAPDGTRSAAVTIAPNIGSKGAATSVITSGNESLVAWDVVDSSSSAPGIYALHVDGTGKPVEPAPKQLTDGGQFPSLATNADDSVLAWAVPQAGGATYSVAITPLAGDFTDPSTPFLAGVFLNDEGLPNVAWNGDAFVLADGTGYHWVDKDANLVKSGVAPTASRGAFATNETTGILFSVQADARGRTRLVGRLGDVVDAPLATVYPARVSAAPQEEVVTAFDGAHLLAVWTEARGADRDHRELWSAFLDPSGALIGPPTKLRDDTTAPSSPQVVANGTSFVVTWSETEAAAPVQAWTTLSAADPKPADPRSVAGLSGALTAGGGHALLLVDGTRGYFVDGAVSESAPTLTMARPNGIVWDGTSFIAGYVDDTPSVKVLRYSAEGAADASTLTIADLPSASDGGLDNFSMASDGNGTTLFTWLITGADLQHTSNNGLHAVRLTNGVVDAQPTRIDDGNAKNVTPTNATIAYDGAAWLLGYGTPASSDGAYAMPFTVAHLRFDGAAGTVDVRESITASGYGALALTAGPNGKAFIAYEDVEADAPTTLTPRVRFRMLEEVALPLGPVPPSDGTPAATTPPPPATTSCP